MRLWSPFIPCFICRMSCRKKVGSHEAKTNLQRSTFIYITVKYVKAGETAESRVLYLCEWIQLHLLCNNTPAPTSIIHKSTCVETFGSCRVGFINISLRSPQKNVCLCFNNVWCHFQTRIYCRCAPAVGFTYLHLVQLAHNSLNGSQMCNLRRLPDALIQNARLLWWTQRK